MCGLTGVLAERLPSSDVLRNMTDALRHRGPDDGDVWMDAGAGIALGHRRLAILDLSPAGHQPMHSACGRFVIAYNGEIYNHLEMREELERAGNAVAWRGHSDTETLLACFVAWGVRPTLERTVGMFAFALWDRAERRLVLARDRFGEKPLYYGWARGAFVFGSELKALKKFPGFDNPVDRDVVALYLQYCYVPAPYSIYRNVFKLEPGCLMSLSLEDAATLPDQALFAPARSGGLVIERYWALPDVVKQGLANPVHDEREAIDELEVVLSRAVKVQSIADVPLGAFLSGGIDSSTVVALMQEQSRMPVRTFTIGFEEEGYNEAEYAKAVAGHLGTEHSELYLSSAQTRDVIPQMPELYCEPFADSSQIPTYLLSRMARQYVTVALSGDAGDELFGGYTRYLWGKKIWSRVSWLPLSLRSALGGSIEKLPAATWDALGKYLPGVSRIERLGDKAYKLSSRLKTVTDIDDLYRSLVSEWLSERGVVPNAGVLRTRLDEPTIPEAMLEPEHHMMLLDALTYLPDDILQKVDRAAMGTSLETRVPFLDHRVAELAWRMPLRMKIRNGKGKWVLRRLLERRVPNELIERPKAGFDIPLGAWLRGPLLEWADDLLSDRAIRAHGILDPEIVGRKWTEHKSGVRDWTSALWRVLMLQAWLRSEAA